MMVGLFQAQRTGRGCDVDVSLLDTAISMLSYVVTFQSQPWHPTGTPTRFGHPTLYPAQVFETSDSYIVIMVMKEKFWPLLCEALERPDWPRTLAFAPLIIDSSIEEN